MCVYFPCLVSILGIYSLIPARILVPLNTLSNKCRFVFAAGVLFVTKWYLHYVLASAGKTNGNSDSQDTVYSIVEKLITECSLKPDDIPHLIKQLESFRALSSTKHENDAKDNKKVSRRMEWRYCRCDFWQLNMFFLMLTVLLSDL